MPCGSAVDAAKLIKNIGWTIEDLKKAGVSPTSSLVRDAVGLAKLSDDNFSRVVNEEIEENYAAIIGRVLEGEPGKQTEAINRELAKGKRQLEGARMATLSVVADLEHREQALRKANAYQEHCPNRQGDAIRRHCPNYHHHQPD